MVIRSPAVHFTYALFEFPQTCFATQHSFLSWHVRSRSCIAYMAHIWDYFFFPLRFLQSHRLRGPGCYHSIHWAFVLHGGSHLFRGLCSYDLNIHVQLISPVLFFWVINSWFDMGFACFCLAFQDISGRFFMPGQFTKKKGFILSSISALRLLLYAHIWLQKTPSICFTTPDYHRRDSQFFFFLFLCDTWYHTFMPCSSSGTDLRGRATTCTLPDDSLKKIQKIKWMKSEKTCPHMHIVFPSLQVQISEEEACIGLDWRSGSML